MAFVSFIEEKKGGDEMNAFGRFMKSWWFNVPSGALLILWLCIKFGLI